ncbi:carboxymuconolactone decarboxylase family protein [Peristeroidobacter soli]|uniref:carboxymuconolactone decarboxylase family protein n=1 Tax=Peristeroidobacter soli TaxID=2497877 RepID=UPI00101BA59E|nr:carboxymuconolactone decarboxylase family protein [Peristeroidobacter soli]
MPRIAPIAESTLTPAQRRVYEKVIAGPRGAVIGPLRAVLHSPELADPWQALGEYLRFNCSLSLALRELAIICAGRYWNSQLEWQVHARVARDAGITAEVIEAIRTASVPEFNNAEEAAVYRFARELLHHGQTTDDTYDAVRDRFGVVGVVDLTALVGYYSMVAMTLNAHEVPLPEQTTRIAPLPIDRTSGSLPQPTLLAQARLVESGRTVPA